MRDGIAGHQNHVMGTASRIAVLFFAVLFMTTLGLLFISPSAQASDYGKLSRKYETGGDPAVADPAWGYGAYQMLQDTAYNYAVWLSQRSGNDQAYGRALVKAYELDGKKTGKKYFNATYIAIAGGSLTSTQSKYYAKVAATYKTAYKSTVPAGSKTRALKLQYKYAIKVYYKPAITYWKQVAPGFKTASYTAALRNVLFSCAIANGPYGSAYNILKPALASIGGWKVGISENKLINAIYDEWSRALTWTSSFQKSMKDAGKAAYQITATTSGASTYGLVGKYLKHYYSSAAAIQVSIYRRVSLNERADALALLAKYQASACRHTSTSGGKVLKYYAITDKSHREKVSAKKCLSCGKTLTKKHTRTVKNKYVQSGVSYKDRSGHKYTVHSNKSYYRTKDLLNLRSKASTKGKVKGTIPSKKIVYISKVKMGKDGFWWGKTKTSGATGWVQMRYLSKMGDAKSHAHGKKGKCKHCKLTRKQVKKLSKYVKAIKKKSQTYKTTKAVTVYKSACSTTKYKLRSYEKGKKLKVTKVVVNRYGDYWGRLANGGYVKLRSFV